MIRYVCGIAIVCFATAHVAAAPLVVGGKAVGEFVLPEPAHAAESYGVNDVVGWIEKITGAQVPVRTTPSSEENVKVFVGTANASAFVDDLKRLAGNDGFAVRRRGDHVHVFGSRPRGTLFGLYAFLEKNTDLIFARPHEEFGTIFGKTPDLTLTETDFLEVPVFLNRQLGPNHPAHLATGQWLIRNRDNRYDQRARYPGFDKLDMVEQYHTNFAVPIAKYEATHPEYFGYNPVTKSRKFVKHGEGTMCLTEPGLPAIWAQGLADGVAAQEARTGRKTEHVRLGPGDNWFCCQCERCVSPLNLPDGTKLVCRDPDSMKDPLFRSTQIMMFLNEAMVTWRKLRPDVRIHALAYIHFAEPPRVPVDPDFGIWYAPYPTNNMHFPLLDPRQPEPWRSRFEKWLTMNSRLGFYEYFEAKPSPDGFYAAENLRAVLRCEDHRNALIYSEICNDRGKEGIGDGEFGWDVALMNNWVFTRLFWNPNQDVDGLYRYYIRRTYREAAPQMLAYFDLIKASWFAPDNATVTACHASIAGVYKGMVVDRGLEKQCLQLLADGEAAARHPHSKTLIRRMREQYVGFSKNLARLTIAKIPEIQGEGEDFDSLQWEKPIACDDFRITSRSGAAQPAPVRTTLQAAHDGKLLYLKFRADDIGEHKPMANATAPSTESRSERWPRGDHIEFWLFGGGKNYVFAFNRDGLHYDAQNLDRSWNSGWKLTRRSTKTGWEAIVTLPLKTFPFATSDAGGFRWFCTREISGPAGRSEQVSYQGLPLYYRNFPLVVE